jgi:aerobic-type carbon monoxide dehydrogenase small subunit (CoxS/CutS family)
VKIETQINGREEFLDVRPEEVLLDALRERLHLTGTKDGCREGECGACTVLVEGAPVCACLYPAAAVHGRRVETVEALGRDGLSPVQRALLEAGGVQCGFCTPGLVVALTALLRREPDPTPERIRRAIAGNLCRCTGYAAIVRGAQQAAAILREPGESV